MDILKAAEEAIRQHRLIEPGQGVVAAVSGGADSVALLLCLHSLAPKLGFELYAAHLHHGIRGESADADEVFVGALCQRLGLRFYCGRREVPALAKASGQSLEEAGREARHAFLEEARLHFGAGRIALAHHLDDQAESLLLHLFRGSGLAGLCGMRWARGPMIRPLLGVKRQDIEAYLLRLGQDWRTDETNLCADVGIRNRLRLELLPYVGKYINPRAAGALASAAQLLAQDEDCLLTLAQRELEAARTKRGYDRARLMGLPPALRSRALRLALEQAGAGRDMERRHIDLLIQLLEARTGAHLDLPGLCAEASYESLLLFPAGEAGERPWFCLPLALAGETQTPLGVFTVSEYEGPLLKDPAVALWDADKLPAQLWVRPRQPGDRFFPLGAPGRRKLKDFLIDRKVPRDLREGPMVFSGANALFVPGFGISEELKADETTRLLLRVTYMQYAKQID